MNAFDYPFLISGKPFFGLPVAIPVTFELTILLARSGRSAADLRGRAGRSSITRCSGASASPGDD